MAIPTTQGRCQKGNPSMEIILAATQLRGSSYGVVSFYVVLNEASVKNHWMNGMWISRDTGELTGKCDVIEFDIV